MMNRIFTRFNLMRALRLVIGVIGAGQAYTTHDWLLGVAGLFLIAMAVFNIGCCGFSGCRVPIRISKRVTPEPVEFEEIR